MPGTTVKMFCNRMNILSHRNNIVLFLASNMAAMQNLYSDLTKTKTETAENLYSVVERLTFDSELGLKYVPNVHLSTS